jgi:hypothetical protein
MERMITTCCTVALTQSANFDAGGETCGLAAAVTGLNRVVKLSPALWCGSRKTAA